MKNKTAFQVGGLLYSPALNKKIASKILNNQFPNLTSISLCLEDSISDCAINEAEKQLLITIRTLFESKQKLPLIFIRVRNPEHMSRIHDMLGDYKDIITGYVLPKFDLSNGIQYIEQTRKFNASQNNPIYIMPILESKTVVEIGNRVKTLEEIKLLLDSAEEYILNVRVGGNDFSNMFGIRRNVHQNIYEIGVIRDILVSIINVFSSEYVVSGPVWEYFDSNGNIGWDEGLRKEIQLDLLNGFFGKTAIHPSQLPIIYEELKVTKEDYEDAKTIYEWESGNLAVAKSFMGGRMNEVKCHRRWAEQIMIRSEIYGVHNK